MLLCFVLVLQPLSGFVYGEDLSGGGSVEAMAEEGAAGGETAAEPVLLMGEGAEVEESISHYFDNPDAGIFTIKNEEELRYFADLVNGTVGEGGTALLDGMSLVGRSTPGAIGFTEHSTPSAIGFAVSTTPSAIDFGASTIPGAMSFATSSTPSAISFAGKTIKLAGNIELTDTVKWIPIGTEENPFGGIFDGGGYRISGLVINKAGEDYQGLFGYAKDAVIKSVTAEGTVAGGDYVGGIIGFLAGGELDQCVNKAQVAGSGNAGGIAGGVSAGDSSETGVIRNCTNLAEVQGEDGKTGSLAGGTGEKVSIANSFSYWKGGAGKSIPPLCSGTAGVINSFYLADDDEDDSEQAKNEQAFKYGEVAYLLEGGAETHSNVWIQGEEYPVFGEGSVYKLTLVQPETAYEAGTVSFVESAADSDYKILTDADGRKYVYLSGGAELELKVERADDPGFADYQLSFYPARAVEKQEGEADKYLAKVLEQDVELTYKFWKQVPSDIEWYLNGPSAPYQIGTEGELLGLAELVNGTAKNAQENLIAAVDFSGKTIELKNNITVTGKWTPIGNLVGSGKEFKGIFDGKSFTIGYELGDDATPATGDYLGLFGRTNGAMIKNLTVSGKVYAGGGDVGGIVGRTIGAGSIANCCFWGMVNAVDADSIGGIAGRATANASITASVNKGTIKGASSTGIGGIVGKIIGASGAIDGNINEGSIEGTSDNVGGIAGDIARDLSNAQNRGNVTGTGSNVGGVVGKTSKAITGSSNEGKVEGKSYVGGIAGSTSGAVQFCYNLAGEITGVTGVGSILGQGSGTKAEINGCFSYTIPNTSLALSGEGATVKPNNCYLAEKESLYGQTVDAFKYGKVLWLLNGGTGPHTNAWTQGPDYPVWGNSTMYRLNLIQPAGTSPAGTVTLGEIQFADSQYTDWPLFAEEAGSSYYLPAGTRVALNVQRNSAPEDYQLIFIPADKVISEGESYSVTINENISLFYEFVPAGSSPVGGAWYNNGEGNSDNKFIIETEEDLSYLAKLVAGTALNSGLEVVSDSFSGKTVELGKDIELTHKWTPIGTAAKPFQGTFVGNNHMISGLDVAGAGDYQGLFSYTSGGAIEKLSVSGTVAGTGDYVGGIVGYAAGTVLTDCRLLNGAATEPSRVTGHNYVGGVAGYATETTNDCINEGVVSGASYVGGIAGGIDWVEFKELGDCTNTGAVTGNAYVGGIAGQLKGTLGGDRFVKNAKNSGTITGYSQYIGGIAGQADTKYSIVESINSGTVEAQGTTVDQSVGGLVGWLRGMVSDSSNTGDVTGTAQNVGGIAGQATGTSTAAIKNSYNTGTITGGTQVGGISGKAGQAIEECYNRGSINGETVVGGITGIFTPSSSLTIKKSYNARAVTGETKVGGIVGDATGTIENCYNLEVINGTTEVGGIAGKNSANINYCFSLSNNIRGDGLTSDSNSYYLVDKDSEDPSEFAKKAEAFQYGEVAWLLDGGEGTRSKIWTQGDGHPILKNEDTTGTIYKLTLEKVAGGKDEAGTVELADPLAGSSYKIFKPEEAVAYTYIPEGTKIQLNVVRDQEYDHYWLEFSPKDFVFWSAEEDDKSIYQATMPEQNTVVSWRFTLPVESSKAWYHADPAKEIFTIGECSELLGLAELVNGAKLNGTEVTPVDFTGRTIRLSKNIEITSGFDPIGTAERPFTGILDGAENKISGLVIASKDNYQGLFGYTRGGAIKNLTVEANIKSSGDYVGGIIGYAENTEIIECAVAGPETGTSQVEGRSYVGGIAGYAVASIITGGSNAAKVGGSSFTGGIIGQGEAGTKLNECISEGEVSGGAATGGIAGSMAGAIEKCINNGPVAGKSSPSAAHGVGGIAGNLAGVVSDSLNRGKINSVGLFAGGISGVLTGTVSRSGNIGSIIADRAFGGIAGNNEGTVIHSYNRGNITVPTGISAGGITGRNRTSAVVKYCYNYGTLFGASSTVGAITGSDGYINNKNCYYSSAKWQGDPVDKDYVTDKSKAAFAGGEVAWLLDGGKELIRKGIWSQKRDGGDGYPIFADQNHGVVFKAGVEENTQGILSLEPAYEYYNAGEKVTVIAAPASGFMLKQINVSDGNYKIMGTRTDESDGSITYAFNMPETDVRISAEFVPMQSGDFKVAFNANGGKFTDSGEELKEVTVTAGKAVAQPKPEDEPVWGGKVFLGWFTEAIGGETYDFTVSVTGPLTLYAHWKEAGKVIVTFDANGGKVNGEPVYVLTLDSGSKVSEPPRPQWDSRGSVIYTFEGWFTQRSGGVEWDFAMPVNVDLTLYARWSKQDGFAAGTTPANAFVIENGSVLKELADSVNNGENYAGKYFALGSRIDLDNTWSSIGNSEGGAFRGNFDGRDNTIAMNGVKAPLFGYVGTTAKISDITLTGSFEVTKDNLGTVAAYNYGTISGVDSSVNFTGASQSNIGGLIGTNYGNVSGCENQGAIFGYQHVGGIIGYHRGSPAAKAEGCQNSGAITGQVTGENGIQGIGGIIGAIYDGIIISGSVNSGPVSVTGSNVSGIGGVVGLGPLNNNTSVSITGSRNESTITVTGSGESIGGLIGFANAVKMSEECSNEGQIMAESANDVGGLVGRVNHLVDISNSHNKGEVSGKTRVGGLLGRGHGQLKDCSNEEKIEGFDQVGGVIGAGDSKLTNCHNNGEVRAGGANAGGLVGHDTDYARFDRDYAVLNCYSTGSVTGSTNVGGLIGLNTNTGDGGIINSFWYGKSLEATDPNGVVNGIGSSSNFNKNNYYGSRSEQVGQGLLRSISSADIQDANDGKSSEKKTAEEFASGKVAYLLDTGNDGSESRPKAWTQDDQKGHPELDEPSYYEITVKGGEGAYGTVRVTSERTNYAQGDSDTPIYAGYKSTIKVTATPKASETRDGVTYSYSLEKLIVTQDGIGEKNITDKKVFTLEADAVVEAVFKETQGTVPQPPPYQGGGGIPSPPGGSIPPIVEDTVPVLGEGIGDGLGTGDGSGDGGIGTGSGGGIGDGSSDGQGGASDRTASADSKAPSDNGQEGTDPLVIAQRGEQTTIEKNTGDQEDGEQGGSPTGGGGDEDTNQEDEEHLTVFEIVRNVVKENPLIVSLVSTGILGILAAAGWRRYRRNLGDR